MLRPASVLSALAARLTAVGSHRSADAARAPVKSPSSEARAGAVLSLFYIISEPFFLPVLKGNIKTQKKGHTKTARAAPAHR